LIEFKKARGHIAGPAISDTNGRVFSHRVMNDALLELLEELFETHRELFPPSITSLEILRQRVQVYRTLKRTSDTRAIEKKVRQSDIDVVNRWKALERADGNRPNQPMRQHYAELELLLGPFLRYTWSM
jgi:vacuolar-type H+-ATPase subunit I/STV1